MHNNVSSHIIFRINKLCLYTLIVTLNNTMSNDNRVNSKKHKGLPNNVRGQNTINYGDKERM
jgi:hypothetical protein